MADPDPYSVDHLINDWKVINGFPPLPTPDWDEDAVGSPNADMVNHPPHYTHGGIEVLDFIEAYFADEYLLGNVVKYLSRYKHKGNPKQDLEKAMFYLKRKIDGLEDT